VRNATIAAFVALVSTAAPAAPTVIGLDHVPIAVNDLARAAEDYKALGFALKPGRPHEDGIENQHVKFTDGTELELIAAPEARDTLTATYRRHLANGDGPAFMGLFARGIEPGTTRPTSLDYVFLSGRNKSPTDRPEHFAHANSAQSLVSVWLAGDDLSRERRLLPDLGARVTEKAVRVPDALRTAVAQFQEGDVLLLPGSHQLVPGRRIVGVTLRVGSLEAARAFVDRGQLASLAVVPSAGGRSVFLPPSRTHGLWIELREVYQRPR
jgi:catechol 2,3-dioxygenase-like lactoylglutathione lyase family enzyme